MMGPNFPPSRGRVVTALAATAVGGTHPAGRPLPSLIVGAPSSPAGHARATRAAAPLASLVNLALPMRLKTLLSSLAADPAGTVDRRARALETFRDVDAAPHAAAMDGLLGLALIRPRAMLTSRYYTFLPAVLVMWIKTSRATWQPGCR